MAHRKNISSGTPWESIAGYSRAVRIGNIVQVSGTTASDEFGNVIGLGDPHAQAMFILKRIKHVLNEAGAKLTDVIRTRIYVTDISQWEEVARAHAHFFREIRPANTLVQVSSLVSKDHLVEIEAEAVIIGYSTA